MYPGETEEREGTFQIENNMVYTVTEVPVGTVITLSEVKATAAGVTYGTPVFSGEGLTHNADGSVTFTAGSGLIEIGLENPVTVVPPVTPPTTNTPPTTTTTTYLATTGAESLPLIIVAALLLITGAIALVARRRRGQA